MRVRINELNFSYGQKKIINNLSFQLSSGDFLSIIGKNGTGKSTFVKCLLGLYKVKNGSIFLDDIDINQSKRLYNVGYVPQKPEFNYEFPITVKEILHASYKSRFKDEYFKNIVNLLDLNKFYNENINNLSGGQLQRIFIARALLSKPKLLILDEPTVGVDSENLNTLHNILKSLKQNQVTVILITHDVNYCHDLTDYTLHFLDLGYEFIKEAK